MIKGGIDGSNTQTGNKFKNDMFFKVLENINKNYRIQESPDKVSKQIINNYQNIIGYIFTEERFYNFFKINWENKISKQLRPDICIFINGTIFIIECKFQQVGGSVDEKLQTCDFKKKQYEKLMFGSNIKVEYVYVLNNYFYDERDSFRLEKCIVIFITL